MEDRQSADWSSEDENFRPGVAARWPPGTALTKKDEPITPPPRTSMFRAPSVSSPLEGVRGAPADQPIAERSAVVQERPSLGSLQRVRHGRVVALRGG